MAGTDPQGDDLRDLMRIQWAQLVTTELVAAAMLRLLMQEKLVPPAKVEAALVELEALGDALAASSTQSSREAWQDEETEQTVLHGTLWRLRQRLRGYFE